MPAGKTGFGMGGMTPAPGRPLSDLQSRAMQGDTAALLTLIERHLARLDEKYVEQPLEQTNVIQLAVSTATLSQSQKLDYSSQPHNSLIVCVIAGTLNLYLNDATGASISQVPNFGQYAAGSNQQYYFPLNGRIYTAVNPSTTVVLQAVLIPLAI